MCTCGLLLFIVVPEARITVTIKNPSLTEYQQLQSKQSSLTCSCTTVSIPYSNFVSLSLPAFHQVCSSSFVSQSWISSVFGDTTTNRSLPRAFLSAHFRLLASFCSSSQQTISSGLEKLGTNQFFSVTLQSSSALATQVNSTMTQFYTQTSNSFSLSLALILNMTLNNQVPSAYQSNWYYLPDIYVTVTTKPQYYGR